MDSSFFSSLDLKAFFFIDFPPLLAAYLTLQKLLSDRLGTAIPVYKKTKQEEQFLLRSQGDHFQILSSYFSLDHLFSFIPLFLCIYLEPRLTNLLVFPVVWLLNMMYDLVIVPPTFSIKIQKKHLCLNNHTFSKYNLQKIVIQEQAIIIQEKDHTLTEFPLHYTNHTFNLTKQMLFALKVFAHQQHIPLKDHFNYEETDNWVLILAS